jgi:hypothetical protein
VIAAAIIAPAAPVLAFATLGPLLPAVYATAGFVAGGAATAASGLRLRQRERREGLELKQDSLWVGSPYLARASAISKGGTTG